MQQAAESLAAYQDYFTNGIIPASDISYMIVILIVAVIAVWQARVFVNRF